MRKILEDHDLQSCLIWGFVGLLEFSSVVEVENAGESPRRLKMTTHIVYFHF